MGEQKIIINTVSELYFIIEFSKYLSLIYNREFSFKDVEIDEKIKNNNNIIIMDYLALAEKEGWVTDIEDKRQRDADKIKSEIGNYLFDLRDDKTGKTLFGEVYDKVEPIKNIPYERLTLEYNHGVYFNEYEILPTKENVKVFGLTDNKTNYKYLSALACMYAKGSMEAIQAEIPEIYREHPMKINWVITKELVVNVNTILYLVELSKSGKYNWLSITYEDIDKDTINRINMESWLREGKDKGIAKYEQNKITKQNVRKGYTIAEKKEYMKELDIEENDVIYIFERVESRKGKYNMFSNEIENVILGVIREIKEESIVIDKISYPLRKVDKERDYEELGAGARKIIGTELVTKEIRETYNLANVAIEQAIGQEKYFIVPIWHIDGKVSTFENNYHGHYLNQNIYITETEYVAKVLVENHIKFNDGKMIDKLIEKGDIVDKGNDDLEFRIIPQYINIGGKRQVLK